MFTDEFLSALGDWQTGWSGDQDLRRKKADTLSTESLKLPLEFRAVDSPCYRSISLTKHDIACVIINNGLEESVASWTTDLRMAKNWQLYEQSNKVLAAIFRTLPEGKSVILNINRLWKSRQFISAVENYAKEKKKNSYALQNFKGSQSEVILNTNLLTDDIIGLTGMATDFDILCDLIELNNEEERKRFSGIRDLSKRFTLSRTKEAKVVIGGAHFFDFEREESSDLKQVFISLANQLENLRVAQQ